jgi:regulator of protease activity HflC (stomatin/prohibitin superfamily)
MVLEADGEREAAIKVAEGQKQAAILKAEGEAQAIEKVADADRYRLTTVATGEGEAITKVFNAIHEGDPTSDLITIRYLDALTAMADGQATKIFLPFEASALLGGLGGIAEVLKTGPLASREAVEETVAETMKFRDPRRRMKKDDEEEGPKEE